MRPRMTKFHKMYPSPAYAHKANQKANLGKIMKRRKKKPPSKGSSINGAQRWLRLRFTMREN